MTDCIICGKKNSTIEIKDSRFSYKEDRTCIVCTSCFNLWAAGRDDELHELIRKKLLGEGA